MSVRFFGEYLVQKGVISAEALVSALLEQMSGLPSVGEIMFMNKWMTADELMKIFHVQQDRGEDFISACKKMGIWSQELHQKLDEWIKKERVPLGEVLVKKGAIDIKTLTKNLDDYLAQAEVYVDLQSVPEKSSSYAQYQPGIIAEVEMVFDERKKRALKVALGFIRDRNQPDVSTMTKLFSDSLKIIKTIMELIKLFGIEKLHQILLEMERILITRVSATVFTPDELSTAADLLIKAVDEAWEQRDSLIKNFSEEKYFSSLENQHRFNQLMNQLKAME